LAHVPIIHQLFKADIYAKALSKPLSRQSEDTSSFLHHTVVTPEVYALSMAFFLQGFKVIQPHKQTLSRFYNYSSNMGEIHDASPIIKWIGSPSIYGAVKIGNTIYKVFISTFLALYLTINYIARRSCDCASWRGP
jgi:hypothetical protein